MNTWNSCISDSVNGCRRFTLFPSPLTIYNVKVVSRYTSVFHAENISTCHNFILFQMKRSYRYRKQPTCIYLATWKNLQVLLRYEELQQALCYYALKLLFS